jgi:hypothetical protein
MPVLRLMPFGFAAHQELGCQLSYRHPAFRVLVRFLLTPTKKTDAYFLRSMPFGFAATKNGVPTIVADHQHGPSAFFLADNKKTDAYSILPRVCCYSQRTGADRTSSSFRVLVRFSVDIAKRMCRLRSMPFGFAATLREQTAESYRHLSYYRDCTRDPDWRPGETRLETKVLDTEYIQRG